MPDPPMTSGTPNPDEGASPKGDTVHVQTIMCGRCGWPNACRVQSGMRAIRFMCQWCDQMTTGIVDASLKRHIIF